MAVFDFSLLILSYSVCSDYIFKYSDDLPRAEHYSSRFKKYCRLAGVKSIRFHNLRHSHASLLIASGEDRFTVSKRLGHSSTTFTETIYGHLFPDKQNSITSLLEETFEKDFKKSVQFCAISPEENRKTGQKKDTKNAKFVGITMFIA
ncbi:tyrosine-type recombinase/integrase [Listeria marthii]|uniref:tyrosine-type recombinase/integrase n=1 Tax=Listeria marthii TaxID=529731 RepID=UPI001625A348|nr:tyrosine-type recombinase/integrase [Listeria marthii]MBC2101143.1 tyrosine-type recombinase/integrase [Listeria marthii]